MDLSGIELQVLQGVGVVVGAAAIYAAQRVASYFGLKLKADQITMLNSAVDKAMTLGVTQADNVIREKGWDHVDSKNAVVNFALGTVEDKFADALKANGIDLTQAGDREQLMAMMQRMWPDVAARLSASPVTPPSPVMAAVVAAPPAAAG